MSLFQVTKKQVTENYELRTMTGDIVSFTPSYSQLLPDPFSDLNVTVNVEATGGNGTPDNPNPINGFTEANITRCGVNILGGEPFADIIVDKVPCAVKDTANKTITYEGQYITNIPLFDKFKTNTQYTFFIKRVSGYANMKILYTDGTLEQITTFPQTSASNKSILNLSGEWQSGTSVVSYDECGVFEGVKTVADFIPYNGQTYTIAFGQTVYGGQLIILPDRTYFHGTTAKTTFTGTDSEGWQYSSGWNTANTSVFYANRLYGAEYTSFDELVFTKCDRFPCVTRNQINSNDTNCFGVSGTIPEVYPTVRIDSTLANNVADFKTWLSNNNTEVEYKLDTPFDIDLTPEVISAIVGENNVFADCGQTTVTCLI